MWYLPFFDELPKLGGGGILTGSLGGALGSLAVSCALAKNSRNDNGRKNNMGNRRHLIPLN